MKKLLSLLIAISLVLSISAITVPAAEETVFFESFENGLDEWTYNNDYSKTHVTIDSSNATEGKSSVKIIDDTETGSPAITSKEFKAEEGMTYSFSADFKAIGEQTNKIYARFFDKAGNRLENKSFYAKDAEWKKASLTLVAPAGTVSGVILVSGVSAGMGGAYIDNIKVVKTDAPKEEISAPATPAKTGDVVFSESFENGTEGWSLNDYAKEYTSISTEKASDGKASLYVIDESAETTPSVTKTIAVAPGLYNISVDSVVESDGNPRLYCYFLDANKKQLNYKSVGKSSSTWSTTSVDLDAPEGTAYLQMRISVVSTGIGKGYIDNIKVIKGDDALKSVESDINAKIAAAKPGDVIEIPDGTYNNTSIRFYANGEEGKPITLKAQNPGKAIFTGQSSLYIKGKYLIADGFLFEGATTKYVIQFEDGAEYSQLTNSAVINSNPADMSQQKWVIIKGSYNKVSDCYFRGKVAQGQMVEIIRQTEKADYHTIENCYFGDYKESSLNGYETVRIGTSTQSLSGSYSTLTGCFFEECNGEVETVSVKSCNNFITNNTLYNNKGAIVLRHGNGTVVSGNLIMGGDPTGRVTGIRVIGEDHKVFNNYFYNTPVSSTALYISNGNPNPLIHEYLEVKNADVHNNTFINVDSGIVAGEYLPSNDNASNRIIPPTGKIYNNAIISYKGSKHIMESDKNATGITFENNYVNGKKVTQIENLTGINQDAFEYKFENGFVTFPNGAGADLSDVNKAPKSPFDVMPDWIKKDYYDTGKITFKTVANDPFNNPETTPAEFLPEKDKITVFINGRQMKFDVEPQLINSRTMVPMRAVFEAFNAVVEWDEATASATATLSPTTIKITENSDIAYVNSVESKLDSPAVIIDGRFLIPLRFVSEAFGASVEWVDASQTVIISYASSYIKKEFPPLNNIPGALTFYGVTESGNDGSNHIEYTMDGNNTTKWAVNPLPDGSEGNGVYDLGSVKTLDKLHLAFQAHASRIYTFSIFVSEDAVTYTPVIEKASSTVKDGSFEIYDLKGVNARYVKYVAHGNDQNTWSNVAEFVVTGK